MATRYYPTTKAPATSPHIQLQGTWDLVGASHSISPVRERYVLQRVKEPVRPGDAFDQIKIHLTSNWPVYPYNFCPDWTWMTNPLQAQTLSGNFNFCFQMCATVIDQTTTPINHTAVVRPNIYMYIADGFTLAKKQVVINNVALQDIPQGNPPLWYSWNLPLVIGFPTPITIEAGDRIVIEFGFRIISITPPISILPNQWLDITLGYMKTNEQLPDAVVADAFVTSRAPWIEFSDDILEQPILSTPPANTSCSSAIDIPALPYMSDFVDSTFSVDASNAVWWKHTAAQSGPLVFFLHGSNINASIQIYTGVCGFLSLANTEPPRIADDRSYAITRKPDAVRGTTYYIRVADDTLGFRGGRVRLSVIRPSAPQADDLIIAATSIAVIRPAPTPQYVNIVNHLIDFIPTGISVDYTGRPMRSLVDNSFHTGPRLHVGVHTHEVVVILDAATMDFQVDYIGNPENWWVTDKNVHMGQLYITTVGRLITGWFGDGYNFIAGKSIQEQHATLLLSGPATNPDYTAIQSIDATHGENQINSPHISLKHRVATTLASWAFTFDEANNILYYVTGGMYLPSTIEHQTIKRFNTGTNSQMADFATIPASGAIPGLKGLELLPDGSILVCNGNVVNRVSPAGTVVGTYVPTIPADSTLLIDLALTVDKTKFWVIDSFSTRVFQFDITSGLQIGTFQPYLTSGSVVQLHVYNPPPDIPLPEMSGLHFIKDDATHDIYNTIQRKIPNPTIKTALLGE